MENNYAIIAIDPAGNFYNGKGGTGIAMLINFHYKVLDTETLWAKNYESKRNYYDAILEYITSIAGGIFNKDELFVIIEDFKLQYGKAKAQSNQTLETSELIGWLEGELDRLGIKHTRQANTIKSRWPDKLLRTDFIPDIDKDFKLKETSRHAKDALRHLAYAYYFNKDIKKWKEDK